MPAGSDPHAERRDRKRNKARRSPRRDRFVTVLLVAIVKRGKKS